jgi:hypothetical protein
MKSAQAKHSERRLVENEAVFRRYNERVQEGLVAANRMAREDGHDTLVEMTRQDDMPLHFYCECSDENCSQRIVMKPADYRRIHRDRKRFILLPGHEVNEVECVVERKRGYSVVKKFEQPPEDARELRPTDVKNV